MDCNFASTEAVRWANGMKSKYHRRGLWTEGDRGEGAEVGDAVTSSCNRVVRYIVACAACRFAAGRLSNRVWLTV